MRGEGGEGYFEDVAAAGLGDAGEEVGGGEGGGGGSLEGFAVAGVAVGAGHCWSEGEREEGLREDVLWEVDFTGGVDL